MDNYPNINNNKNVFSQDKKNNKTSLLADTYIESDDIHDKLSVMTNKFLSMRKDRDQLQKENKDLQNEILILQSNIRQMIPGFSSNTSASFPMYNELQNKITEFFKCHCQDIFFDLLAPELNMDGIIFFFKTAFSKILEVLKTYFTPSENILKKTICIDELWSPIDNVLRKSYQANWKKIFQMINLDATHQKIMLILQNSLKLRDEEPSANICIVEFIKKSLELFFLCYISDPIIIIDIESLGDKISYSGIKHDSLDGFIKPKHECVVIIPAGYKSNILQENMVLKSQVLPIDYEFEN
jgi:hypothetical protein